MPLHLYERPTLISVSVTERNLKGIFASAKRWKWKQGSSQSINRQQPPEPWAAPRSSFPGNYAQHLSIKLPGLELCLWTSVLHLHLFCAFLNEICPKVSEKPGEVILGSGKAKLFFYYKLMVTASSHFNISAYKKFHRNALYLGSTGSLYSIL